MTRYLAVEAAVTDRWRSASFGRLAAQVEVPRGKQPLPFLSLSSEGVVAERPADAKQQPAADYAERYWTVRPGELVVNPMWLIGGGIGVTSITGAVSPDYRVYRLSEDLEPQYVHHLLRAIPYREQYRLLVRAETTFDRRITKQDFSGLPIPVPPRAEQQAIADYLDRETARIDALVAARYRTIALLHELWRSAVARTMAQLTAEHGSIQMRHVVRCLDRRRIPLSGEERAERQGEFPYYGASAIVDWIDDWLFDEQLVLLGEDGAQLGDPTYPIAQVVRGKLWVNNHAHVLRPVRVDAVFLALHLNTVDRVPVMSGGTREKITQDDMNRIPVPNIPVEYQREVGGRLGTIRSRCDALAGTIRSQVELLRERRQALTTAAVTGQVEVPVAA